jgi:hypothetical protein
VLKTNKIEEMRKCFSVSKKEALRTVMLVFFFNIILLLPAVLTSCAEGGKESSIEIKLEDEQGNALPGLTVYEYSLLTWKLVGDTSESSSTEAVSDTFGMVKFNIASTDFIKASETFYYSCHYQANGVEKTASIEVSLKEGEDITKVLILK